jgi:hypothetical protein
MLHRWHQFFLPTRTNTSAHQRGNISILSLWWISITMAGCIALVSATSVVHNRAALQSSADAIALALVSRGEPDAQLLARTLSVTITRIDVVATDPSQVTVHIKSQKGSASAEAIAWG